MSNIFKKNIMNILLYFKLHVKNVFDREFGMFEILDDSQINFSITFCERQTFLG
jgi:hypothetical protein